MNELISYLQTWVTPKRLARMEEVLANRTRFFTVVLEDFVQSHNASAVIRSAECFGVQDVHIVENDNAYGTNKKVLKGSHKWLNLHRYHQKNTNNSAQCFNHLVQNGYQLLLMDPAPDAVSLNEVPIQSKIALVLGSEQRGLSDYAQAQSFLKVRIPMVGFTESFNVSVSAALAMQVLVNKIRTSDVAWALSEDEKQMLRLAWLRKSVRNAALLEKEFYALQS